MGVKKGYRIQLGTMLKQLYPEDWMITPMLSWSLYQMAVTKYKANETHSSSIYNQNAPTDPQVRCCKFITFIQPRPQSFSLLRAAQPHEKGKSSGDEVDIYSPFVERLVIRIV